MKKSISFALLLPAVQLLFCAGLILVPAIVSFIRLRHLSHGTTSVSLTLDEFRVTIPVDKLFSFAFGRSALRAQKVITTLNVPALFVEPFISPFASRFQSRVTESLLPFAWRSLFYPLCGIPAWFYVGRGFDSLLRRRRVRWVNAIFSLILAIMFCALFVLIRFGLSVEERQGLDPLHWDISGVALWAVLFAIPFTTWLARKLRGRSATQTLSAT